jgi:outer membrane protein assembly factor BamB
MPPPSKFISSARRRRRPRWPIAIAGVLLLGAAAAAAVYLIFFQKEGDFSDPNAQFQSQPVAPPPPKPKPETFKWPIYGYTPQRTRDLPVNMGPPARKLWRFTKGHGLIEFQPVLANGFLYYVNNSGQAFAVNAKTGKKRWSRKVGSLVASSPAWNQKRVFVVTLNPGSVLCLNSKNGKVIWRKSLPSRSESSPIVVGGVVYFGSENGTIYAYRASNGAKVWTYHAPGAVKAGLAYNKGVLYFGAYGGSVTALRAKNGSRVWSSGTSGASFNRSGNFYSTPAVAYGRVYLGNTDSFVYSFVASSGRLAWRHATGSYVYAAPAVSTAPRIGPAVFIGSYDGNFYALDAKSGGVKWTYHVGGRISGAPSVIGDIVYFSSLGNHDTTGLDVRTGHKVWHFKHGAFNPMVADGKRFYLTTNSTVFGLAPHASKAAKPKAPGAKARSQQRSTSR